MTSVARARLRRWRLLACACALTMLAGMALAGSALAASNAGWALINGDSVTTDDGIHDASSALVSLEQFAAEKAGFTHIDVVTGAQWDAMSAADFAKYQVLIVGDPDCSSTPASVNSNAATWAPVVMGSGGNRALIGTDPEDHYAAGGGGANPTDPNDPTTAGAEHLVRNAIAFAGAVPGATGISFDTSCEDPNSGGAVNDDIATLDRLTTTGAGHWTENTGPPCGGTVSLIAEAPSVPGLGPLTTHDLLGWGCSVHISFPQFPTDWNALALATDPSLTHPTCGVDKDTGAAACGEAYVLVSGAGVLASAPDMKLAPLTGKDTVGTAHTVTATVTQLPTTTVRSTRGAAAAAPAVGVPVAWAVSGANGGAPGTCTKSDGSADPGCLTDSLGQVRFTYTGKKVGNDTINASFVNANSETEHATATETWVAPAAAPPPVITVSAPSAAPHVPVVCLSTRRFTIHVQRVHRYHLVSAHVTVNGKAVPVRHRHGEFTAVVDLRNLTKGRYDVLVTARSKSGKLHRFTRRYHTCNTRLPGGHPLL